MQPCGPPPVHVTEQGPREQGAESRSQCSRLDSGPVTRSTGPHDHFPLSPGGLCSTPFLHSLGKYFFQITSFRCPVFKKNCFFFFFLIRDLARVHYRKLKTTQKAQRRDLKSPISPTPRETRIYTQLILTAETTAANFTECLLRVRHHVNCFTYTYPLLIEFSQQPFKWIL